MSADRQYRDANSLVLRLIIMCMECGALIGNDRADLHDAWHDSLDTNKLPPAT